MERDASWQGQTDVFLRATNIVVCGNDYTATTRYGVRNLFAPPNATNSDPRPVFLAINCSPAGAANFDFASPPVITGSTAGLPLIGLAPGTCTVSISGNTSGGAPFTQSVTFTVH